MRIRLLQILCGSAIAISAAAQTDSLIYAEGRVINAQTKELISARITYQSLPYGNRIGVINNSTYSFPIFDGEKYSIIVEASGYAPVKYLLDPVEANAERRVVKDIELSNSEPNPEPKHPVGEVLRLNNLIFEVGKSKIASESFTELDVLAEMMQQNPNMIIQLEGHTDYLGNAKENLRLSQERVMSVRNYLTDKGLSRNRIKTKAFGGIQPLSRDNTPEAHRMNRRVEVRILAN